MEGVTALEQSGDNLNMPAIIGGAVGGLVLLLLILLLVVCSFIRWRAENEEKERGKGKCLFELLA